MNHQGLLYLVQNILPFCTIEALDLKKVLNEDIQRNYVFHIVQNGYCSRDIYL